MLGMQPDRRLAHWSGPWTGTVVGAMLLLGVAPADGQGLNPQQIYERAAPSVVVIVAYDEHKQPQSLGSGFAVESGGVIATNLHLLEGASSIGVKRTGQEETSPVEGVYAVDEEWDLALLKVPFDLPPLPLTSSRPSVGQEILAIGNPRGLESTLSEGIVSGIRDVGDSFELYQITAPISPGSSGGPVLDGRGQVVGVATAAVERGEALNFAVPSSEVIALKERRGQITSLKAAVGEGPAEKTAWITAEEGQDLVRAVDLRLGRAGTLQGSLYNGTQFTVKSVQLLVVCYRKGVEVPIDYSSAIKADEGGIPPGLSEPFIMYCSDRATDYELRILDYEVER